MSQEIEKKVKNVAEAENDGSTAHDLQQQDEANHIDSLEKAVENGSSLYEGDFFIQVNTSFDPLFHNVLRNHFIPRQTCPSPNFDQSVYKYHSNSNEVEFIWVVPDKKVCIEFMENPNNVPESAMGLLKMVGDFALGELDRKSLELNGEDVGEAEKRAKKIVEGGLVTG